MLGRKYFARVELEPFLGQRLRFRGTFKRFGTKPGYRGRPPLPTLILIDIHLAETGQYLCDHCWFNLGKKMAAIPFKLGVEVEFDATVERYIKGCKNNLEWVDERRLDYKLSRPGKIEIFHKHHTELLEILAS